MFNKYIYNNTNKPIKNIKREIKKLEFLKNEFEHKVIEMQNKCNHGLILSYDTNYDCKDIVKKSNCLVCGSYLELVDNFEIFSEKNVDKKAVIDITDLVEVNNEFYVEKAKEKLEEIMKRDKSYTLVEIKSEIKEYLIGLRDTKRLVKRIG